MQQVPATDDFTITWPDPKMAEAPWVGDRMHFPEPTVQLAQYLIGGFQELLERGIASGGFGDRGSPPLGAL